MSESTQKVYDYLKEKIISGEFAPGSPISELEVSKTFNVSRSPVREAIMSLEGEGLVKRYPNKGCFVSVITKDDIKEIFELRSLLEVAALRTAYQHITEQELDQLEQDLQNLKPDDEPDAYFETDRRLHGMVNRNCGNMRLIQILRLLNGQIEQLRRISASQPKRLLASRQEHLAIVAAMKKGDIEAACEAMKRHIGNIEASTLKAYMEMGMAGEDVFYTFK